MKKLYFTLLAFLFLAIANAQIVNIPDANFKAKLLEANSSNQIASTQTPDSNGVVSTYDAIDTNGDGEIQVSEASVIKYLNVGAANISSLEGISSFTNLQILNCSSNQLTNLSVTDLTNLQNLNCSFNELANLTVSGLANLSYLNCDVNQLSSLDVTGLINLLKLSCGANLFTSIDLTVLTNLQYLSCESNQLTNINISGLTDLQFLNCYFNQLPSLNVSGLTNLQYLYCSNNQLTTLDVNALTSLEELFCSNNQLTSLDVDGLTSLIWIDCSYNQLTSLNVNGHANLVSVYCYNNQLTSLFVKNGHAVNEFEFEYNPNLTYICTDEENFDLVQLRIDYYGYTNCQVDSSCFLSIDDNVLESNNFTIYPNPVNKELSIQTKQATEIYSITIYNLLGQQVQTTTRPAKTIDVSSLETGNYIIKVITDKGVSSSKFIKK